MKTIALLTIGLAFLFGAYLSVLDSTEVAWVPFVVAVALGFVGVVMLRRTQQQAATSAEAIADGTRTLAESLRTAVAELESLIAEKDAIDVYDLPGRIDDRIVAHLNRFAANRDTLKHAYGLQAFADIMSRFAGGERYLNRVWSASVDGYIDEAHTYLERSREQLDDAYGILRGLAAGQGEATI